MILKCLYMIEDLLNILKSCSSISVLPKGFFWSFAHTKLVMPMVSPLLMWQANIINDIAAYVTKNPKATEEEKANYIRCRVIDFAHACATLQTR